MTPEELLDGPAWALRDAVVRGEAKVADVVNEALRRIAERDGELHSFLTVDEPGAREAAARLDAKLARGEEPGPLFGVPVSLKDLFETAGLRTTSGSRVLEDYVPDADSVHAERLRAADAVIVGKTNTPEFAIFIRTANDLIPETMNPWDPSRSCGGSSGGAAASVAAGFTQLAVASDGGGSTRVPAALCGVVGVQPSRGVVPHVGGVVGTLLFSSAGPIARDVRDAATLLQVLAGPDDRDPACVRTPADDYVSGLDDTVAGVSATWVERSGLFEAGADIASVCRQAAATLVDAGASLRTGDGSMRADRWREGFYAMMMADRYAAGGTRFYEDPAARELLTDYARIHFDRAAAVTGAEYSRGLAGRFEATRHLESLLGETDLLVTPTVGRVAPALTNDRVRIPDEVRLPYVAYTYLVNYTGYTAATIPCGTVDGLPVGLQLIGRPGSEPLVLRACRAIERATG